MRCGGRWWILADRGVLRRLTKEPERSLSEHDKERPWQIVLVCKACAIPDWIFGTFRTTDELRRDVRAYSGRHHKAVNDDR